MKRILQIFIGLWIFISLLLISKGVNGNTENGDYVQDILQPYDFKHGSHKSHRQIRECQSIKYGNMTHEIYPVKKKIKFNAGESTIETNYFTMNVGSKWVKGHYSLVSNALQTISVLEPINSGGCKNQIRATVPETAKRKNCIVAMNGGFFNTTTGHCLGNIVSDGVKVQDSAGIQNAQFGILKDGSFFTGYLSEQDTSLDGLFQQLISGVIWLLRANETYIEQSQLAECPDTQETGTFKAFVNVISARTALGHDAQGRVIMLHIDGKTGNEGVNLWELAAIMKRLGAINAINTDGGGSATYVVNGTVVNYPSDYCNSSFINCARPVTTIICAHYPECAHDCGLNGVCRQGRCECYHPWSGAQCDILPCQLHNCSGRGDCSLDGCKCSWGWFGEHCEKSCPSNFWGPDCSIPCFCENEGVCNNTNGVCICQSGYIGRFCERRCPLGWHGVNCSEKCNCTNHCACYHVNGSCDLTLIETTEPGCTLLNTVHVGSEDDYSGTAHTALIIFSVVVTVMATPFIIYLVVTRCRSRARSTKLPYYTIFNGNDSDDDDEDNNVHYEKT